MKQNKAIKTAVPKTAKGTKTADLAGHPAALKKLKMMLGILVAVFAFALYVPSVSFKYTLDDPTVLKENFLVKKGFGGIAELLKTDYWFGTNIRIPEYRPAPLVVNAVVWQFFPDNPAAFHLVNVLLFTLTCYLLFLLLVKLFEHQNLLFPFLCTVLYVAHPIHTEVVNSIKSLDEILCFLFAIVSLHFILDYSRHHSVVKLIIGAMFFFFSLLSKETGITYLIITPLVLYVFTKSTFKQIIVPAAVLAIMTAVFFYIRFRVLDGVPVHGFDSPLNNSLTTAPDFISQKATACFVLLNYLLLLIFPHPLSYDYSYNQLPILKITDPLAMAALLIYIGVAIYAFLKIKNRDIVAFGILFYLITLAPVSNMFIIIGSPMAERFLYMPSLGFCIALTYLLLKIMKAEQVKSRFNNLSQFLSVNSGTLLIIGVLAGLYSVKTIARSQNWKDNISLFSHDIEVVPNSAKAHLSLGCAYLSDLFAVEPDRERKKMYIDREIEEFNKAVAIYPNYQDAYLNLGVAYSDKGDFQSAIKNYQMVLKLASSPEPKVYIGLSSIYLSLSQNEKALIYADSALKYHTTTSDPYNNRACALEGLGKYEEAMPDFKKAISLSPKSAVINRNIGGNYGNLKQYQKAIEYLLKSYEYDPNDPKTIYYLGITYRTLGDSVNAKRFLEMASKLKL